MIAVTGLSNLCIARDVLSAASRSVTAAGVAFAALLAMCLGGNPIFAAAPQIQMPTEEQLQPGQYLPTHRGT